MDSVKDRLLELLGLEPLILLSMLALLAFGFYKIFLRNLIMDRHKTMNRIFNEILTIYVMFLFFWFTQYYLQRDNTELSRFFIYAGIAAVVAGAVFFVRTVKVIVFEYLFFIVVPYYY